MREDIVQVPEEEQSQWREQLVQRLGGRHIPHLFRESQETCVAGVGKPGEEWEETSSESRNQIWEGLAGQ